MWNDIESSIDYLHFSVVSRAVADLIEESGISPISIGVSGSWGSGKSSMVNLIGQELKERDEENKQYIFIKFNAWLYQGYADARSALLYTVSKTIESEMKERKIHKNNSAWKKLSAVCKRIDWFQASKLAIPLLAGFIPGVNAVGAIGGLYSAISGSIKNQNKKSENNEAVNAAFEKLSPELKDLLKEDIAKPSTEQIEELRTEFQELLELLNVKLIVLVDDLDRCLPETAISTLEAMRLLLFVDRTAFIIAADEQMIRNGVKAHFGNVELSEGLVTSYFDKLIQVPITVPRLGIAEIKAYIVLLYIEAETKKNKNDNDLLKKSQSLLNDLLSQQWKKAITRDSIESALHDINMEKLPEYISIADQLSGILATAETIMGNPRLIKRFLNAIEIRKKVAVFNGMTVDYGMLTKMLLFERCASVSAFDYLSQQVEQAEDGKPAFLKELEDILITGKEYQAPHDSWDNDFIRKWLLLPPFLGDVDLRPMIYLSKDKSTLLTVYDDLSPEGRKIVEALKAVKTGPSNREIISKIKGLGEIEATILLNQVARIGRSNNWTADTVCAAIHITEAFPSLGDKLALALSEIPTKLIKTSIIPLIRDKVWANALLSKWSDDSETPQAVKKAIAQSNRKE